MKCETCTFWVTRKYNHYTDGSTIDTYKAPDGKGLCDKLNMETAPDFGCNKYLEGTEHAQVTEKQGAPWQHPNWHYGPCPDCKGVGCHMVEMRPACRHCAGTGKVRYYDDGYIADASWDHPKEKELKRLQKADQDTSHLFGQSLAKIDKAEEATLGGGNL